MIARSRELERLRELQCRSGFEYLIMYGRRRVGKTTLLLELARESRDVVFYPARLKNDVLNREEFSRVLQTHFEGTYYAPFPSWREAFEYVDRKATVRTTLIIDEFPFLADENPSIKSELQHAIDHRWKQNPNLFLILCGSSVSFMETEIMGIKSPLHDRQTATMEVCPFDYYDSARFFPAYSAEEKLLAYGILGGVPRYLETFDDSLSIRDNIARQILAEGSALYEEPMNLLRAELRETNVYNSILTAIANGRNRVNDIADYTHEEAGKVSKYLLALQSMRLVERSVPCGESEKSKKGIYEITDPFFRFWFRYSFTDNIYYRLLGPEEAADEIMKDIHNQMGPAFEKICREYLIRQAMNRKLPFVPAKVGKWWGNNPATRARDDVDVLLLDRSGGKALFAECKYTSRPVPLEEYEDLKTAALAFPDVKEKHYMMFSRSGYTEPLWRQAEADGAVLLDPEDLFKI